MVTAATPGSQDTYEENRAAHRHLTTGIRSVTYTDSHGAEHNPTIRLLDLDDPDANTYRALNQVTVIDGDRNRRFDVILYVNGLPLAAIELKRAGDEDATLQTAHAQVARYVQEFPTAFRYNAVVLLSDGITAKYGTPFTPYEHFAPWNTDEFGARVDPLTADGFSESGQNLALHGLFTQSRFLELIQSFINFVPSKRMKRIAKPHQYHAVTRAADAVRTASASDGKAGVVWHTQGSGKSEEMVLTTTMVMRDPALLNPTVVVITDRTDLDDQLYSTFQESEILPETPKQVVTRAELREELAAKRTGGILFTTLQKFGKTKEERESGTDHPMLSDRRNIVVIVDEAHRSHYDDLNGLARHLRDALPHATLLAFTGTPISEADRNTREVFGDYIDVYDLKRAADDGATVKVYHESRVIQLVLDRDVDPTTIDEEADRITDGLDDTERRRVEQAVATMNAMYGAPARIRDLAADLVEHWEARRERMKPFVGASELGGAPGKAMVVCATREICVRVYDALRELRPEWHSDEFEKGTMKIVFSSNSRKDSDELLAHALTDSRRKAVINRAKDPDDELELLIVNNMLLTGFDAPPIHTMYLDRPLKGANLMQALARVNRRFRGKEDGLLVGYAPLTENLQRAIAEYTEADQRDRTLGQDVERALDELRNEYDILTGILRGFAWEPLLDRPGPRAFVDAALKTANHLRDPRTKGNNPDLLDDPRQTLGRRFRDHAYRLERFWALAGSSKEVGGAVRGHAGLEAAHPVLRRGPRLHGQAGCHGTRGTRPPGGPRRRAVPLPAHVVRRGDGRSDGPLRRGRAGDRRPHPPHRRARRPAPAERHPAPGGRGAAAARRAEDARGHPAQHRPADHVLRAPPGPDGALHAPAVHQRRTHRQARRDGQGRHGRREPGGEVRSAPGLARTRLLRRRSRPRNGPLAHGRRGPGGHRP
ncbi:hypothetical protein GCM10023238_29770 [Streptomyces heliomycini]